MSKEHQAFWEEMDQGNIKTTVQSTFVVLYQLTAQALITIWTTNKDLNHRCLNTKTKVFRLYLFIKEEMITQMAT